MLGAVHSLDVDDVYNGYFLPAGTMVLPNQWYAYRFLAFAVLGNTNL